MRYLKSIVTVVFLSMAVLLVFDSCSTSKKTTTRKVMQALPQMPPIIKE